MDDSTEIIDSADVVPDAPPAHGPHEHGHDSFSTLDRGYGKAVATGYLGGIVVIFGFMFAVLSYAMGDSLSVGGRVLASGAVAFWIGIMGGVVAVGMWAQKHEEELFH
jgi:hypothetical protein